MTGILDFMGGSSSDPSGYTTSTATQKNTATQTPNLPAWATRILKDQAAVGGRAFDRVDRATIDPLKIAQFNPDQQKYFQMAREFGESEPYLTGLEALTGTAGGDFLYGGPAQQAFVDAAVRQAQPGIFSAWGGAGRTGGMNAPQLLGRTAIDAYAGLYNNERDRMMAAAGQLPAYASTPLQLFSDIGNQQFNRSQAVNDAKYAAQKERIAKNQWLAQQGSQLPWSGIIGQTTTGSSEGTQSDPYFENKTASGFGGALAGLSILDAIMPGAGTGAKIAGAGLGGILGLL